MAHDFSAEDKEVQEYSDRIEFGVHTVQALGFGAGATEDGKEYIEVGVVTKDGVEDKARVWFTGGAAKISFNVLRQIAVHNAKDEDQKAKARDAVDGVKNTDELADLMNKNVMGGELWLTKYYDATRTYENAQGQKRRSINTNIYGYQPKLKPELMPKDADGITNLDRVKDAMPGATEVDNDEPFPSGPSVPSEDAWKD